MRSIASSTYLVPNSRMKQTDPQFKLRIPANLKTEIEDAAKQNKRSVTAEILSRLQESFAAKPTPYAVHTERDATIQVLSEMYEDTLARIATLRACNNLSAMDQVELQHEEETAKYLRHAAARATAAALTRTPK